VPEHGSEWACLYTYAAAGTKIGVYLPGSGAVVFVYGLLRAGFPAFRVFTLPAENMGVLSRKKLQIHPDG